MPESAAQLSQVLHAHPDPVLSAH